MSDHPIFQYQEPFSLLDQWIKEAQGEPKIKEATAMTVTTRSQGGELTSRVVLCRGWSQNGLVFYSNYKSLKGKDLESDPHISALFYWDPLFRQIKISGKATKTSRADSVNYWNQRPRENQLSQWISRQSEQVDSRATLNQLWQKAEKDFEGKPIPCPEHWGGYLIEPITIEFWIGQTNRLHDSFVFKRSGTTWTIARLFP